MDRNQENAKAQEQIDENLRKVYQKTLQEEVPDRFMSLLQQLRDQDTHDGL